MDAAPVSPRSRCLMGWSFCPYLSDPRALLPQAAQCMHGLFVYRQFVSDILLALSFYLRPLVLLAPQHIIFWSLGPLFSNPFLTFI